MKKYHDSDQLISRRKNETMEIMDEKTTIEI